MFAQALFSISLRLKISRREIKNNVVAKVWRDNKKYYGIFGKGLLVRTIKLVNLCNHKAYLLFIGYHGLLVLLCSLIELKVDDIVQVPTEFPLK